MQLKDLVGLDDLSHYTQSPVIFNQRKENSMSNNKSTDTLEQSIRDVQDKLLILNTKLDVLIRNTNTDPIDLLSESEKEFINQVIPYESRSNKT